MQKHICKLFFVLFLFIIAGFLNDSKAIVASPYKIVQDPAGVYVVEINTAKTKNKLIPFFVKELETNKDVYERTGSRLVVNAGFFDPKNQKTVSYVLINGQMVLNPEDNENLMNNEALKPFLDKILNRSEFRITEDKKGNVEVDIAPHNAPVKDDFTIKHSLQAGPMLLPELRLEEEFFVLKDKKGRIISESASSLHKYARTAIGIRENNVYLFIVTTQAPMTLEELSLLAKKWGMEKAMAFDGGGSTSFDSRELHVISEKDNSARKLKSFLILR